MRVVLITDRFSPEPRAAAYHTSCLARGWCDRGHSVTVFTRRPAAFAAGSIPNLDAEGGGHLSVVRLWAFLSGDSVVSRLIEQLSFCLLLLGRLLMHRGVDVVYVLSPPLLMAAVACVVARVRGIPLVLNLHDLYPQAAIDLGAVKSRLIIKWAEKIERFCYGVASFIFVAAPASRRILVEEKGVPSDRVEVLWNFYESVPVSGSAGSRGRDSSFTVLYAGRMGLAQDIESLIECAAIAQRNDENWSFVVFGDGPKTSLVNRALSELHNVSLRPPVPIDEFTETVLSADVGLALLSAAFRAPAVPGKVQAMMACGRPVVAMVPRGNDTHELIEGAECGFCVESGQPLELYYALRQLSLDSKLREDMAIRGREYARTHFSVERAVAITEACLQSVAKKTSP